MSRLDFIRVWNHAGKTNVENRRQGGFGSTQALNQLLSVGEMVERCRRIGAEFGLDIPTEQIETVEFNGQTQVIWDRFDHMTPAEHEAVTAAALDQIDAWEASGNAWPFKQSEAGPTT